MQGAARLGIRFLAVFCVLAPPAMAQDASGDARPDPCADNLAKLYAGLEAYLGNFGDGATLPPHSGARFWICLAGKCGEPWKHADTFFSMAHLRSWDEVYKCPAAPTPPGSIDYTGPSPLEQDGRPIHWPRLVKTSPERPLACDRRGNHPGGGHVLRADGTVAFLRGDDYAKALAQTRVLPEVAVSVERAVAASGPPAAGETGALVLRLESAAFAERREAQARLAALGGAAVPALERALAEARSPEVRSRLESALAGAAVPRIAIDRGADGSLRVDGVTAPAGAPRALLDRIAERLELRIAAPRRRVTPATADRIVLVVQEGSVEEEARAVLEACAKEEPGIRTGL